MTAKDANELLLGGGGGKAASFPRIGTIVQGEVISEPESREQTDIKTKEVKRFNDGSPMMQVLVRLQTTERDPSDPEDDGVRTVYAKSFLLKAIGKAMRQAGVKALEIGGFLEIGYIGDGPRGDYPIPPKLFEARYTPPAPKANSIFLDAAGPTAAQPQAATVVSSGVVFQNQHRDEDARPRTTLDQMRQTSYNAQGQVQPAEAPF